MVRQQKRDHIIFGLVSCSWSCKVEIGVHHDKYTINNFKFCEVIYKFILYLFSYSIHIYVVQKKNNSVTSHNTFESRISHNLTRGPRLNWRNSMRRDHHQACRYDDCDSYSSFLLYCILDGLSLFRHQIMRGLIQITSGT